MREGGFGWNRNDGCGERYVCFTVFLLREGDSVGIEIEMDIEIIGGDGDEDEDEDDEDDDDTILFGGRVVLEGFFGGFLASGSFLFVR